jgi:ribosomal protein S27AE
MDSYVYTQIAEKILSQAVCPRCGAVLQDCAYDILSANNDQMVLELDCEDCGSVLTAHGVFQRKSRVQRQRKNTPAMVSPETVRGVVNALREFRGDNLQDLLQK